MGKGAVVRTHESENESESDSKREINNPALSIDQISLLLRKLGFPHISVKETHFPFTVSKIRHRNARLPVAGCRKPRSNVKIPRAARPCAETHRSERIASTDHQYEQYHRPAATDDTRLLKWWLKSRHRFLCWPFTRQLRFCIYHKNSTRTRNK